jgi:hypothetical protein
MDQSDLAKKMLIWEALQRQLGRLEEEIADTVLILGETQVVGNVRATYYTGRKTFDYEMAGRNAPEPIIKQHTTTIEKVDWKTVCELIGSEAPVKSQSEPSVRIKLED